MTDLTPVENQQRDIAVALSAMRYGASVSLKTPDWDTNTVDFLRDVADWLQAFNRVLANISDTTTDMAQELTTLRSQRKAVRDFLGLTPPEGTV